MGHTCGQLRPTDQASCATTAVLISIKDRVRPNSLVWMVLRKDDGGRPYLARNASLKRRTRAKTGSKSNVTQRHCRLIDQRSGLEGFKPVFEANYTPKTRQRAGVR